MDGGPGASRHARRTGARRTDLGAPLAAAIRCECLTHEAGPGRSRWNVPDLALSAASSCVLILNHMVQHNQSHFNASFAALADATRRGVLEQLARADASITELADKFQMTLTGMKKHVGVLEQAGLVTTEKIGRVRTCKLGECRLEEEAAWIDRYRQQWDTRFNALDEVLEDMKRKEKANGRRKKK
jgi:DNA-binding transcriptional ArsR family regulator